MSTPVSPTGPPTEWPPQARGPITKLPPELLLETLDHLLAQLPSPLKRQRACQLFLRVNRAFNEAYHLSSASKECILTSVNQVTKLVDKLEYWAPGSARVRHLTIDLEHKRLFSTQLNPVLLARLIKANSTELKRSTVKLRQEGWSDGWKAEPSLTLSWAECTELVEFEFSGEDQEIGSSQAKSLLAAWPRMEHLHMINFWIEPGNLSALPDVPTQRWTMPTRLRSLELLVYIVQTADILGALIKASADTLTHLRLAYVYDNDHAQVQAAMPATVDPVKDRLISLRIEMPGNGGGDLPFVAEMIGPLTKIASVEIPLGVGILDTLAVRRQGRPPLERLTLYDRDAGAGEDWFDVLAFLSAVKVDRLRLSSSWFFWPDEGMAIDIDAHAELAAELEEAKEEVLELGVKQLEWIESGVTA